MKNEEKKLKFKDAYSELEEISRDLQNDEIDLDLLIDKVKRAAFLIKHCKSALSSAESEIEAVISEVDDTGTQQSEQTESEVKVEKDSSDENLPF